MTKKRKMLIPLLFMGLSMSSIFTMESFAVESSGEQTSGESALKDENAQRLENVTGMDENGNVFEVEDTGSGVVESSGKAARAATIKQVVNFRTKGNAVTKYTEDGTGAAGYTNGAYGGDAAYLGTSGGKVKFMLSGVVGWVPASEVQVLGSSQVAVVSCYQVTGGSLIHRVAHDITTPGWATSIHNGTAPSYLAEGGTYYSYDGHYFYTDYATMIADYQNNTRSHSVNSNNPFYNYFQYLPLRSSTRYSGSELTVMLKGKITSSSSKLLNTGSQFVDQQNVYGVNALLMASVGANESGWGTSSICQQKNNLFGLNAVDDSPGTSASTYASVGECIRQFADGWMSRGYLYPNDSRYKGGFLGNKGSGINVKYASDPYWGEKAASIAWNLDKNGGSKDNGYYTLGVKDTISTSHNNVNVRSANSTSSASLYKTGQASNYAVILLENQASNAFYKIQSDAVLNSGRTAVASGVGAYNFANMYAYISSDYITVVNSGKAAPVAKTLQSIYIGTQPSKSVYTEGEKFNPSGMVVKAKWSDGTETDVTNNITYSKDVLGKGTASVTVQYSADGITKEAIQNITVKEKPVVTEVVVNPSSVEMKQGESKLFGVAVAGTGNPSRAVTWSVEGAKDIDTNISTAGKLQIGQNETALILTIKATSAADSSKSAAAVVTIIQEPAKEPEPVPPNENAPDDNPAENPEENPGDEQHKPSDDEAASGGSDGDNSTDTPENADVEIRNEGTGIWVSGAVSKNTKLEVNKIDKTTDNYEQLIEQVKTNTILGVYDIKLGEEIKAGKTVQLGFDVGSQYEGQKVIVLHYYDMDGRTFVETLNAVVENGKVTINVSSLSPFVLALDDAKELVDPPAGGTADDGMDNGAGADETVPPEIVGTGKEETAPLEKGEESPQAGTQKGDSTPIVTDEGTDSPKVDSVKIADNPQNENIKKAPKTGDENQILLLGILLMISMCAIVVGVRRFRKSNI